MASSRGDNASERQTDATVSLTVVLVAEKRRLRHASNYFYTETRAISPPSLPLPPLHSDSIHSASSSITVQRFISRVERTRTPPVEAVQPVATRRQSPYAHKPPIVKLLLLIYSFQFGSAFRATTTPSRPRPLRSPNIDFICSILAL